LTFYIKKDLSSICPFSTQPNVYLSNGQTVVHWLLLVWKLHITLKIRLITR